MNKNEKKQGERGVFLCSAVDVHGGSYQTFGWLKDKVPLYTPDKEKRQLRVGGTTREKWSSRGRVIDGS
jgi:hypothetical protein